MAIGHIVCRQTMQWHFISYTILFLLLRVNPSPVNIFIFHVIFVKAKSRALEMHKQEAKCNPVTLQTNEYNTTYKYGIWKTFIVYEV